MIDILYTAQLWAQELVSSQDFQEMKKLDQELNQKYLTLLKEYQKTAHEFSDVLATGGRFHPDFDKVSKQLVEVKMLVFAKPEIKQYLSLENQFELNVNQVLAKITKAVSPNIKSLTEVGLFKMKGSCHASKKNGLHY